MRFKGLDLNLIVALDALLSTRSVSRAAEITCISQPAMSAALARLRDYFNDPLLIFKPGSAMLSPLGENLREPVAEVLVYISDKLVSTGSFEPESSTREFRILAADTVILGLLAGGLRRLDPLAPSLRFSLSTPSTGILEKLDSGQIDLLVVPEQVATPSHPSELLVEEQHAVIACAKSFESDTLSVEDYFAADHVEVFIGQKSYLASVPGDTSEKRRIAVKVDQFALVPFFISDTRRLATVPGMTAELYSNSKNLKYFKPPFAISPVRLVMQWHSRSQADAGLTWLRRELRSGVGVDRAHKRHLYRLLNQSI
ncbi:LysR family transcriptional regulator [Nioella sp.]|uniref:LysR family transcriptional regulator n=1 Tax=Nioella sp. TaxID=1912091 RepID=UPI00351409E9